MEGTTADHTVINIASAADNTLNVNDCHVGKPEADNQLSSHSSKGRCLTASFSTVLLITLILISVVLGRQYIIDILIYIDSLDFAESTILFAVMFTVVAFPIMWGYVLLNIACGYTYGFMFGTLMTAGCAAYAILCAHLIIRRFFKVGHSAVYDPKSIPQCIILNSQTYSITESMTEYYSWKYVKIALWEWICSEHTLSS